MPLHDWARVTPNDHHSHHVCWIAAIRTHLNTGGLPKGYYALPEHVAPPFTPDVPTLGTGSGTDDEPEDDDNGLTPFFESDEDGDDDAGGGTAVATQTQLQVEATIRVKIRRRVGPPARWIAVRHVAGRRLVAVIELVSPGNKSKAKEIYTLTEKAAALLRAGVHVTIIDPFPNPKALPHGFGGRILKSLGQKAIDYAPKFSRVHVAFAAQGDAGVAAKFRASEVGEPLPALPLFLTATRGVKLPLEDSYTAAWAGYPKPLRAPLEGAAS